MLMSKEQYASRESRLIVDLTLKVVGIIATNVDERKLTTTLYTYIFQGLEDTIVPRVVDRVKVRYWDVEVQQLTNEAGVRITKFILS